MNKTKNHKKAKKEFPPRVSSAYLKKAEKKLGIVFRKKDYLLCALTHSSLRRQNEPISARNFERLEFLGDAVLSLVISEKIFQLFPVEDEGFLSLNRSALVSRKSLSKIALKLSIPDLLLLAPEEKSAKKSEKVMCDALEAVFGALYLDQGMKASREYILRLMEKLLLPTALKRSTLNPKTELQEWVQKRFKILPEYRHEILPQGQIIAWVKVSGLGEASGKGKNKKQAQERAARVLLKQLKKSGV